MVDHWPDEGGTPWLGWVDTAALLSQARAYELAGSVRHAEAAYSALIVAATRQQDHATLAAAFRHRAVLAHQAGDTVRARSALQQSYAVATILGDRRLTAETLNTLGGLELETRNLASAEAALLEAEALASEEPAVLARVEQNLGIVANIRGQHDAAEAYYRRSLAAYEALPDPHGSAIAHHNLGMLAADRGDLGQAAAHYDACERLAEASKDTHLFALCLLNRAEVLVALGRSAEARRDAESAERAFHALGAHFDAADVHRVLGLCDRAEGLLGQARLGFQEAFHTPAEIEGLTLEEVVFTRKGEWTELPLDQIPPRLFSEAMRDLDLVVSVAHQGGVDPEATASTVEMRAALVRETCGLLGLDNVEVDQHHVRIQGKLGRYAVHLGSAGVMLLLGTALPIVAVHSQHRGRLFLPFADDDPRTAEVLSKVLLLARDREIRDPSILEWIRAAKGGATN